MALVPGLVNRRRKFTDVTEAGVEIVMMITMRRRGQAQRGDAAGEHGVLGGGWRVVPAGRQYQCER